MPRAEAWLLGQWKAPSVLRSSIEEMKSFPVELKYIGRTDGLEVFLSFEITSNVHQRRHQTVVYAVIIHSALSSVSVLCVHIVFS